MSVYRRVLREVGLVVLIIGVADIGLMIYCIMTGQNYSSSLNIFAVVAGIFLMRGSLAATKIVTWFAAFLLAGVLSASLVLLPLLQPFDLWLTEFRLDPAESLLLGGFGLAVLAALVWVYWRLRSPEVVEARVSVGQSPLPPRSAFVLGITLAVGIAILFHFTMGGENAAKAIQIAESQNGPGYKYYVTDMHWFNSTVHARVKAYNEHEVKSVEVEWQR
jgi:hypothetical protein